MRIKTAHLLTYVSLLMLLGAITTEVYSQISSSSGARAQRSEEMKYDTSTFDFGLKRLPLNYLGVNPAHLYEAQGIRERSAQKDEFETTEQFRLRVQKQESEPILGNIMSDSIIAVVARSINAQYDADQQLMRVIVDPSRDFPGVQFSRELKQITEDIKMDIPTAKNTKPRLRALAVVKLQRPAVAQIFRMEPQEIWFFDGTTGEVFVKRKIEKSDGAPVLLTSAEFLTEAQKLYQAGRDEEAFQLLRRVLTLEPTSAEAFLLIGRINQRLGDQQAAISALKTAIFWESKTIEAHILLGRIFLELGDRAQALSYARSATMIDPNNQEAATLLQQVQRE